jgi:hypothetical protein
MIILISSLREFVTGNLPRPIRDTLPAQREYHVRVTRPKHRVPRPSPASSLTYIPGILVRVSKFEPSVE